MSERNSGVPGAFWAYQFFLGLLDANFQLVGDGHGAHRAGADDPPGCRHGSAADPDREDEV